MLWGRLIYYYKIYSLGVLFGGTLCFFYTFIRIYFSSTQRGIIDINPLGEANLEMALLLSASPGIISFFSFLGFGFTKKLKLGEVWNGTSYLLKEGQSWRWQKKG